MPRSGFIHRRRKKRLPEATNQPPVRIHISTEKCTFSGVSYLRKIQNGGMPGIQQERKIKTTLSKTFVASNISLSPASEAATSCSVTACDLEQTDHRYLVCGRANGTVAIYDLNNVKNSVMQIVSSSVKGHKGNSSALVKCVQWYPIDTGLFTSSASDDQVLIWDSNRMRIIDRFRPNCGVCHHHMSLEATKHSLLAVAGATGEIALCDLRSGSMTHRLLGHEGRVQCVQWNPENQYYVASGGADFTVRLWDVRAGRSCLRIFGKDVSSNVISHCSLKEGKTCHQSNVISLKFTKNGQWLTSLSYDGKLKVWNSGTGEVKAQFRKLKSKDDCVPYPQLMAISENTSPDLLYVPSGTSIFVYELLTGKLITGMDQHYLAVAGVIYNPRSLNLYSYGRDKNVVIWKPGRFLYKPEIVDEIDKVTVGKKRTIKIIVDEWSSDDD